MGGEPTLAAGAYTLPAKDLGDIRLMPQVPFGRAGWRYHQGLSELTDGVSAASLGQCSELALCHDHRSFSDRHKLLYSAIHLRVRSCAADDQVSIATFHAAGSGGQGCIFSSLELPIKSIAVFTTK